MVTDKDWIDAPGLLRWLRDEYDCGPETLERMGYENAARSMREWANREVVSVYTADEFLTKLQIPLAFVPDELYRDWRKPASGKQAPEEVRKRAVAMYMEGYGPSEIARMVGRSPRTVGKWLQAAGVSGRMRVPRYSDEVRRRALQMLRDGCTQAHIARTLGISASAIKRWLDNRREEMASA